MDHEKTSHLLFTPNQEKTGQEILTKHNVEIKEVDTLYFFEHGKLYDRSTAALHISRYLRFPWNLAYMAIIIPQFIRDAVYNLLAKNRYKWFGRQEICRLPTPNERERFV